jgi:hypothetical protein
VDKLALQKSQQSYSWLGSLRVSVKGQLWEVEKAWYWESMLGPV